MPSDAAPSYEECMRPKVVLDATLHKRITLSLGPQRCRMFLTLNAATQQVQANSWES